MATINYITLKVPEILFRYLDPIQKTPTFNVCRYKRQPGVIFRIPHSLRAGHLVHCFIEHEVNFSNTLKTGTLTMKVQLTFVPVTHGVFCGFAELKGTYQTRYYDEEDDSYGEESFVPDYVNPENVMNVAPLPIGLKSNLYEYLNELLFEKCDDVDLLSQYAVNLGCQRDTIKKAKYVPHPEVSSKYPQKTRQTVDFFEAASTGSINLLPASKNQLDLFNK